MNKRFLVREFDDGWCLYWCDASGKPGPCVANIFDKETLDLLVSAPAMRQTINIARASGAALGNFLLANREYAPSIFGRFQILMGRFIKR